MEQALAGEKLQLFSPGPKVPANPIRVILRVGTRMPIFVLNQCPFPILRQVPSLGSFSMSHHTCTSSKNIANAAEPNAGSRKKRRGWGRSREPLQSLGMRSQGHKQTFPPKISGGRYRKEMSMSGIVVRPLAGPHWSIPALLCLQGLAQGSPLLQNPMAPQGALFIWLWVRCCLLVLGDLPACWTTSPTLLCVRWAPQGKAYHSAPSDTFGTILNKIEGGTDNSPPYSDGWQSSSRNIGVCQLSPVWHVLRKVWEGAHVQVHKGRDQKGFLKKAAFKMTSIWDITAVMGCAGRLVSWCVGELDSWSIGWLDGWLVTWIYE